ncbi:MAG: cytochrome c biogenesis protein ResB [Phycisphaerae bacterium]|nr:cytochrome c biogenesis protein ResB [Phycisphaerae bacterium]
MSETQSSSPPGSPSIKPYVRRVGLWIGLILIALFIVFAIAGARMSAGPRGTDPSVEFFNSPPLAAFWIVLTLGLLASPIVFPGMRRLGPLCIHLGPALVIIGSLLGSKAIYRLHAGATAAKDPRSKEMRLYEGQPTAMVRDDAGAASNLPFAIRLNRFWMDYYKPTAKWPLHITLRMPSPGSPQAEERESDVHWKIGQAISLDQFGSVEVLEYLPHATASAALEIRPSKGLPVRLEAAAGSETTLADPAATVRIRRAFSRLQVTSRPATQREDRVLDAGGPPVNPALEVELAFAGKAPEIRYAFPEAGEPDGAGLSMRYVPAQPDESSPQPAVRVAVHLQERSWMFWILPPARADDSVCRDTWPAWPEDAPFQFVLSRSDDFGNIKSYNADVSVLVAGQEVERQVVEVNRPLHYGGYHFYQVDWDRRRDDVTIFEVRADTGVGWVFAGYAVGMFGLLWKFWIAPAARWGRGRRHA